MIVLLLAGTLKNAYGQNDNENRIPTDLQPGGLKPPATTLPVPSGPFGIGRIGYEWIDTSRPDTYSANPDANRDLMVYLWYPAPRTDTGRTGPYLPVAKQMDANPEVQRRVGDAFGAAWGLIVSGDLVSYVVENAPVAKSPKHFPVVLLFAWLGKHRFCIHIIDRGPRQPRICCCID
jgi:hypothetical protein